MFSLALLRSNPKYNGLKGHSFYRIRFCYTHRFCELGIWTGPSEGSCPQYLVSSGRTAVAGVDSDVWSWKHLESSSRSSGVC